MSIKELIMLIIWLGLAGMLYALKTGPNLFKTDQEKPTPGLQAQVDGTRPLPTDPLQATTETLPEAVKAQVQIPAWLPDDSSLTQTDLTADDLLTLAQLAHENGHNFFPEQQNALYYLLLAKGVGKESQEIDLLLTTLHAQLYDAAEEAIENYDSNQLTELTARLKSLAPDDEKIQSYTDQLSTLFTLQRLATEAKQHLDENDLYTFSHQDAIHKLQQAQALDPNYPPLIELQNRLLGTISQQAIRAAEEGDFEVANAQLRILDTLNNRHPLTTKTKELVTQQRQQRYTYLDQQFYLAVKNLQLQRAQALLVDLARLKLTPEQLSTYRQQLQTAQTYGPYEVFDVLTDNLKQGGKGPNMVIMPLGSFFMGRSDGPRHQKPVHWVEFKNAFAVAQHEVTVAQFGQFIASSGYQTTAEKLNRGLIYSPGTGRFKNKHGINWRHDYLGKKADQNLPVIHVSWTDAQAYSNWLSQQTGETYRLPSESEFEYVLKAGSQDLFPWGSAETPEVIIGNLSGANDRYRGSRVQWREGVSNYQDGYWGPAPVAQFPANLFALHDLSGNVMEWVEDCWHDSYYRAPENGSAWVNKGCEKRVIRGGHWGSALPEYHSSHRKQAETALTDPRLGFRVAKTLQF